MSQTASSQITWILHPTAMFLAGFFTAYGVYKLCVASNGPQSTGLHRSNAVYQRRRRQSGAQVSAAEGAIVSMSSQNSTLDEALVPVELTADAFEAVDPGETEGDMEMLANGAPDHGIRGLLYYIAEEDAARNAYIHRGICCEGCGQCPIKGVRYHCLNCPDFDLCAACEAHAVHPKNHVFAKIKIPLSLLSQPPKPLKLWYGGDPQKFHEPLDAGLRKQLCRDSGFSEPELDALYDQFTCIANVPWEHDPTRVGAAIDRRAFNKTMSSDRWADRFAPNVLLDRMFAFYDTDGNLLIGFKEFLDGMQYLRGSNRFASLERALRGFDIDGDGLLGRNDFLRILRGKFEIQKRLIIDATEGLEIHRTQGAMNVLRSSQPISSVFNGDDIPPFEARIPYGKLVDANGEVENMGNEKTILDDDDPFLPDDLRQQTELLRAMDRLGLEDAKGFQEIYETEPYIQDLLWHKKEDGLNSLLDPLFRRRAEVERRAVASRGARQRWRTAIEQYKIELEKSGNIIDDANIIDRSDSLLVRGIVPTDHKSLEQMELETAHAPLSRLLEVSGYGIREESSNSAGAATEPSSQVIDMEGEPRAPRNRSLLRDVRSIVDDNPELLRSEGAYSTPRPTPADFKGMAEEQPPTVEVLRLWARLDVVDREIEERGGPEKLSLFEVERIVVDDNLQQVRGLIKSWLEWGAF